MCLLCLPIRLLEKGFSSVSMRIKSENGKRLAGKRLKIVILVMPTTNNSMMDSTRKWNSVVLLDSIYYIHFHMYL